MKTIKDEYGKKIGGSKRDLWKTRGLMTSDVEEMNDDEKKAYVKKDNVWKKPDYQGWKDSGISVETVYYIKLIRDSIAVRPGYFKDYEMYIDGIREIMAAVNVLIKENMGISKAREYMKRFVIESGFAVISGNLWTTMEKGKTIGGGKVLSEILSTEYKIKAEIKRKQFLYSEDEKILSDYDFITKDESHHAEGFLPYEGGSDTDCRLNIIGGWTRLRGITAEQFNALKNGTVIARKGYTFVSSFSTIEEAKETIPTVEKAIGREENTTPRSRKKKYIPKQLESVKRIVGGEESVCIVNIDGDDYINRFGFHGIEFGNYMSELDRQASLNMGYDAFTDLAVALDVDVQALSLDGRLSVAFGARGHGNAAAHYEPLKKVINLTKLHGAGALAHEYGHAIDFLLGAKYCGQAFSEARYGSKFPAFEKVVKAMKRNERGITEYYQDAIAFDQVHSKDSKGYWQSTTELFARAFACYVEDKLKEKNIRNDYLCGHASTGVSMSMQGKTIYAFPRGEERVRINGAIDAFLKELKKDTNFSYTKQSA